MVKKDIKNFKNYLLILILCLFSFTGCATAPIVMPPLPPQMPGIYHHVKRGQTLWRISKIYNVNLDELVRVNHISDVTSIEEGQMIFIPHAQNPRPSATPYCLEDFIWPIKGRITSGFRQTYNNMVNKGINIQPYKAQDVVAARSGRVIFYSPNFRGFGKTVIIDHHDGFSTVYAMNSEVLVKVGDMVQRGSSIAKIAASSRNNYLHFEIRKEHIPQNPNFYLPH